MRNARWPYLGLFVLTLVTYWPIFSADFVDYDDPEYVTANPHVLAGLTAKGWVWAWTTFACSNWHPLTWLSLQLDAQIYGKYAPGFHFTSVLVHACCTLLLYEWLRQSTKSHRLSLVVSALFAVHPLHVESVAWVAERKDVLSTLFGVASLIAYFHYASRPGWGRYLILCGLFAASLASKPMWVTLPILLLLLDYWPLGRWPRESGNEAKGHGQGNPVSWMNLLIEKIPLGVLTVASCVTTILAQHDTIRTLDEITPLDRVANATISYVTYLGKTVWPTNLAIFYPYLEVSGRIGTVAVYFVLLLLVTLAAFIWIRSCPALFVGWLWFLITLVPVIGIVQVGGQAYADRYTYVPHIGLFIAIVWGFDRIFKAISQTTAPRLLSTIAILGCVWTTWMQLEYWQNSQLLWAHARSVSLQNGMAQFKLWKVLQGPGRPADDLDGIKRAIGESPESFASLYNKGNALRGEGKPAEAEPFLKKAVEMKPQHAGAHHALGVVLATQGRTADALTHLTEATRLAPDDPSAWMNLGVTTLECGDARAAIPILSRASQMLSGRPQPLIMLASAEFEVGQIASGLEHYRAALQIDPDWPASTNRVAWNLSASPDPQARNGRRAVLLARRVCQATENKRPEYLDTLAAAYAEAGRFDEAISTAELAIQIMDAEPDESTKGELEARLNLYRERKPFRQPTPSP